MDFLEKIKLLTYYIAARILWMKVWKSSVKVFKGSIPFNLWISISNGKEFFSERIIKLYKGVPISQMKVSTVLVRVYKDSVLYNLSFSTLSGKPLGIFGCWLGYRCEKISNESLNNFRESFKRFNVLQISTSTVI